jgi:Formiminotransferase domain, N-terminal subdomain
MVTRKIGLPLRCLPLLFKSSISNLSSPAIQLTPAKMTTLCVIYVSEGVKQNVIDQLTQKAIAGGPLVHSFIDATYGRTSFYLMGESILCLHIISQSFAQSYSTFN